MIRELKYKTCLLILGVLISLSACQDAIIPDVNSGGSGTGQVEEGDELVPVTLNLKDLFGTGTYSLTDIGDFPGTVPEDAITDVAVYIFKSTGECEEILTGTGLSSLPLGPRLISTGTKNFVALVNAAGNIPSLPTTVPNTLTYSSILRLISNVRSVAPETPFLMTGDMSITVPQRTSAAPFPVTINVERTVSKVTLNFTKSGKAAAKNIVVSKVTLINGADRVGLFDKYPMPNNTQYGIQTQCLSFNSHDGIVSPGALPLYDAIKTNDCVPLDTFYTYENLANRNKTNATYFELEASVDGGSTKT